MRIAFLLLVFVNFVVLAWTVGVMGQADNDREPERLATQLQPEKLQVTRLTPPPSPETAECRTVGPLGATEAEAISKALTAENVAVQGSVMDAPVTYWVNVPPVNDRPAEKDIKTLKETGFKEFFVVTDDPANLNAISLGTFKTQQAAKEKLDRLVRNGIRSARITVRGGVSGQMMLKVQGAPEILDRLLTGAPAEKVDCSEQ